MNKKNTLLSILLIVAFIASWAFMLHTSSNRWIQHSQLAELQKPDGFVLNAQYDRFNTEGKLQTHLQTPRVTHYAQDDTAVFTAPYLTLYNQDGTLWQITGAHGQSKQGMREVDLAQNVSVQRMSIQAQPILTLNTSTLEAFPAREIAQTSAPVTIKQPTSLIHATGLIANLKTGAIELLSQTNGTYYYAQHS